jgi:hypothetical protein
MEYPYGRLQPSFPFLLLQIQSNQLLNIARLPRPRRPRRLHLLLRLQIQRRCRCVLDQALIASRFTPTPVMLPHSVHPCAPVLFPNSSSTKKYKKQLNIAHSHNYPGYQWPLGGGPE